MMRQVLIGVAAGVVAIVVMMFARAWRPWESSAAGHGPGYVTTLAPRGAFPVRAGPPATTAAMGIDRVLTEFRCDELPLGKALEKLAAESGINLVVKTRSLEEMGILPGTKVTLHLRGVTAARALEAIFESADSQVPLAYEIDAGVVTVGTAESIHARTYLQVYDVRDLVLADAAFQQRAAETAALPRQREQFDFSRPREANGLIERTIDPTSWHDNGGNLGDMTEFCGRLVVETTAENHRKIEALLSAMRGGKLRLEEGDWRTVRPLGPRRSER